MAAPNPLTFCDLRGKRGLVLGLANNQSIAAAVIEQLHSLGATLRVSCLNEKAYPHAAKVTDPLGVALQSCNLEVAGDLEAFVQAGLQQMGGFDFVVHSIAWAPLAELQGPVIDTTREGFAKAMSISCHSFTELARLTSPHMQQGGSLVTMSFHGSEEVVPNYGLMGPVKAALESMVRYLAAELGPKSIRVHAVSPGPVFTRAASGIPQFSDLINDAEKRSPLRRLVSTQEIAALVAFLCAPESSGMTGQTLYVDAGYNFMA
jgi:enoyl-[acyl-carrier protein] reductase I